MDTVAQRNAQEYNDHAGDWCSYAPVNPGHIWLEKPAMNGELPRSLFNSRVLCVGAGSGEELELIIKRNPKSIVLTDISSKLLDIAHTRYPDAECRVMDMMELDLPDASFDVVYSSLAFHYASDWDHLLQRVFQVLKPGGILLFSTHHPGYWSKHPTGNTVKNTRGITLTVHNATLPGGIHITYYNHPDTTSIIEAVTHAGFRIQHAFVPQVASAVALSPTERKKYHNLTKTNAENPLFYVVHATRPCAPESVHGE